MRIKRHKNMPARLQLSTNERTTQILDALAAERGGLSYSATVRQLIYEEAERRGIHVGERAEDKEPALTR